MIDPGTLLLKYRGLDGRDRRLKIGLVVDRSRGPEWVQSLTNLLRNVTLFEIHLFIANGASLRTPARSSALAERLHAWSRRHADPFGEVDLDLGEPLPQAVKAVIRARELDLLCWIADEMPEGPCSDLARFGVITIRLGEASIEPLYWQEVIDRQLLSRATILWHSTTFEKARVLRTAELATKQGWFFTRNADDCLVAISRMIATVGLDLLADAPSWMARQLEIPEQNCHRPGQRRYPSNVASAGFLARQAWRSLSLRAEVRGRLPKWFVAIRRDSSRHYANTGKFSPEALEEVPLAPGSQMADPFLVTHANKTWLFFEDVPAGTTKGRLSCMEAGVEGVGFSEPTVALEENYHLSYPCVVSSAGEFFLIPESCKARTIQLFRATRFPFEWRMETTLMDDFSAVD
ncbi:MAG: hypothetical protein QOG67_2075, partial [Verrucomicrobiota bacterium]